VLNLRGKMHGKYLLAIAANFSSSYTWRFYELLVSWAEDEKKTGGVFRGWIAVSVDDLRNMMGMPDSYQWVHVSATLEKVTAELKEKAQIAVTITQKKTSRKITHLRIEFKPDEQIPMPLTGGEMPKKPRKSKATAKSPATP